MHLTSACLSILDQLAGILHALTDQDYRQPSAALGEATVGQHLRHTLEFFICLEQGLPAGVVNYDHRAHDHELETNRSMALHTIARIREQVACHPHDFPLHLELSYTGHDSIRIASNYWRELTYNIEHAVHHMALMKIGLRDVAPYVQVPAHFGVASSTVRHHTETRTRAA